MVNVNTFGGSVPTGRRAAVPEWQPLKSRRAEKTRKASAISQMALQLRSATVCGFAPALRLYVKPKTNLFQKTSRSQITTRIFVAK